MLFRSAADGAAADTQDVKVTTEEVTQDNTRTSSEDFSTAVGTTDQSTASTSVNDPNAAA